MKQREALLMKMEDPEVPRLQPWEYQAHILNTLVILWERGKIAKKEKKTLQRIETAIEVERIMKEGESKQLVKEERTNPEKEKIDSYILKT
jgi:hypothetical protein